MSKLNHHQIIKKEHKISFRYKRGFYLSPNKKTDAMTAVFVKNNERDYSETWAAGRSKTMCYVGKYHILRSGGTFLYLFGGSRMQIMFHGMLLAIFIVMVVGI